MYKYIVLICSFGEPKAVCPKTRPTICRNETPSVQMCPGVKVWRSGTAQGLWPGISFLWHSMA